LTFHFPLQEGNKLSIKLIIFNTFILKYGKTAQGIYMPYQSNGLASLLYTTPKRRVFISYHHGNDQLYYDHLSHVFSNTLDIFCDNSLDRIIQSNNTDYIRWSISQNHIYGSSCTIVLCGSETYKRKYVDWEIKATLEKNHGLIGICLPTLPIINNGSQKPERLQDNIDTGYAKWIHWNGLTADLLKSTIEAAVLQPQSLAKNDRPMRQRNG
jgi:hypothetical protein